MTEKIKFISLVILETLKWISVTVFVITVVLTSLNYSEYKKTHTTERYLKDRALYENCLKEHPENISWFCNPDPLPEYSKNFKDFFYTKKDYLIFPVIVFIFSTLLIKFIIKTSFIKNKISNKTSYLSTLIINSINRINILSLVIISFTLAKTYYSTGSCSYMLSCEMVTELNFIFIFIPYLIFSSVVLVISKKFSFEGNYEAERSKYAKVFAFIIFIVSRCFLLYFFYNLLYAITRFEFDSEIIMGTFFLSIPIYYLVLYKNLIKI